MTVFDLARTLPHEFRAIPLRAIFSESTLIPDLGSRIGDDAECRELADAVAQNGVRIPIVVDRIGDSSFRLLDGVRRRYAAERAGHTHIPAVVYEKFGDENALLVRFASQAAREPLWSEDEWPRVLRAILNARLIAKTGSRYAPEYKWRMLGLASDCTKPGELANLLRMEGLTHSHLTAWRRQFDEAGGFEDRRGHCRREARDRRATKVGVAAFAASRSV